MSSTRDLDIWYTNARDLVTVFVNFRHQNEIIVSWDRSGRLRAVVHLIEFVHESRIDDPGDRGKAVAVRRGRDQSAVAYARETTSRRQHSAARPFIKSDDQGAVHRSILRWVRRVLIEWEIRRDRTATMLDAREQIQAHIMRNRYLHALSVRDQ